MKKTGLIFLIFLLKGSIAFAQKKINLEAFIGLGLSNNIAYISTAPPASQYIYPNKLLPVLRPNLSLTANYEITKNLALRFGVNYHWNGMAYQDTVTSISSIFPGYDAHYVDQIERSTHYLIFDISTSYQIQKLGYIRLGGYWGNVIDYSVNGRDNINYFKRTSTEYYTNRDIYVNAISTTSLWSYPGPPPAEDFGPEDFGIYGGIGRSWNDRYSIELAYGAVSTIILAVMEV